MRKKLILMTTLLTIILASHGIAEQIDEWRESAGGLYIKPNTVRKTAPDQYTIWVKRNIGNDEKKVMEKINPKYTQISFEVSQNEHNCKTFKSRTVSFVSYDKNGNALFSNDSGEIWRSIAPDSAEAVVHETTCKLGERIK